MIFTKIISIDTYIFGDLAKDYYCNDKRRKNQAVGFIDYFIQKGYIPFFSFHHLEEILQYENDREIFNRWSLIKKFPMVAWFCGCNDKEILGSIFDIQSTEVKYLASREIKGFKDVVSSVRDELIRYSSGEEFVSQFEDVYFRLRDLGMVDTQRSKAIESISHARDKKIDKIKLSTLNTSALKSKSEVNDFLNIYVSSIEESILKIGDKKLVEHRYVAERFVDEVRNRSDSFFSDDDSSLLEKFVKASGVRLDQINTKSTIGDLGYLGVYNSRIRLISESLKINVADIEALSQEDVPSWVVWREIDKMMKNEPYAHGSNMIDKDMSVLALYVDVFIVDKRVNEYFRQLKTKITALNQCLNKVLKLSHYSKLSRII